MKSTHKKILIRYLIPFILNLLISLVLLFKSCNEATIYYAVLSVILLVICLIVEKIAYDEYILYIPEEIKPIIKTTEKENFKVIKRLNEETISVGDLFSISGERFYVIGVDDNNIKALAEWNLLVGFEYRHEPVCFKCLDKSSGLQSQIAKGRDYVNHPTVMEQHNIGVVHFNKEDRYRKKYNAYNNIELKGEKNNYIYKCLNNYRTALEKTGIKIKEISLITLDELLSLGYEKKIVKHEKENIALLPHYEEVELDAFEEVNFVISDSVPKWVYQTSYWTCTIGNDWGYILGVLSNGNLSIQPSVCDQFFGIRPVITVSRDLFY